MKVISDYRNCPNDARQHVVAIGNFDGVHLGHKKVISTAHEIADKEGTGLGVMTFEPHPVSVLRDDVSIFILTNLERRLELFQSLGVDVAYVVDFSAHFSSLTAHDFMGQVLVNSINASHVITGYDFIFGKGRSGNTELLAACSSQYGFHYTKVEKQQKDEVTYSSTQIRQFLSEGNVTSAADFLGYRYQLKGRVEEGKKLGRTLGFPTANIKVPDNVYMKYGVYQVQVIAEDESVFLAVANLGVRPTVENSNQVLLEVHLLDFNNDLYNQILRVEFIDFIRPERAFPDIEALKEQIEKDVGYVRSRK